MLLAGVGFGKTESLVMHHGLCVLDNPGCKHIALEPTYQMIETILLPRFQRLIDDVREQTGRSIATIHSGKREIRWRNRSITYLRSANEPRFLEGLECATWIYDEAERSYHPMQAVEVLQRRMRQPPDPPAAIPQYYHGAVGTTPRDRPGGAVQHWVSQLYRGDLNYQIVKATTLENPYLRKGYVEELRQSHSDYLFRQQVLAEIIEAGGAIFSPELQLEMWDPYRPMYSGNLIHWKYSRKLPTWVFIDPSPYRPAVLWYQYDRRGDVLGQPDTGVIFHEFTRDGVGETDLVRYIWRKHREKGWGPPAGFIIDPNDHQTAMQRLLEEAFLRGEHDDPDIITPYANDVRDIGLGIAIMKARLNLGPGGRHKRRLLFSTDLDLTVNIDRIGERRGIVTCLKAGYRWKETPDGLVLHEPHKDGVHDHAVDALRYGLSEMHFDEVTRIVHVLKNIDIDMAA